jgi:hypothetical protein
VGFCIYVCTILDRGLFVLFLGIFCIGGVLVLQDYFALVEVLLGKVRVIVFAYCVCGVGSRWEN